MSKWCVVCGREKTKNHVCDMATLSNGNTVHVDRISQGGDLHGQIGDNLKVKSRWRQRLESVKSDDRSS